MKAFHFTGKLSSANLYYFLIFHFTVLFLKSWEITLEGRIPIIARTKHVRDSERDSALKLAPMSHSQALLIWSSSASIVTIPSLKSATEKSSFAALQENVSRENVSSQVFTQLCHKQ